LIKFDRTVQIFHLKMNFIQALNHKSFPPCEKPSGTLFSVPADRMLVR
jgi:hypothetical protein